MKKPVVAGNKRKVSRAKTISVKAKPLTARKSIQKKISKGSVNKTKLGKRAVKAGVSLGKPSKVRRIKSNQISGNKPIKRAVLVVTSKKTSKKVVARVVKPVMVKSATGMVVSASNKRAKVSGKSISDKQKKTRRAISYANKTSTKSIKSMTASGRAFGGVKTTKAKVTKVVKFKLKSLSSSKVSKHNSSNIAKLSPGDLVTEGRDYLSVAQLEHFKKSLQKWKFQVINGVGQVTDSIHGGSINFPDLMDRASQEEEFNFELKTRDRDLKLLRKIEGALARISDGTYGYCDDCGAQIGVKRLEARPTATQCIECKTVAEIKEKQHA